MSPVLIQPIVRLYCAFSACFPCAFRGHIPSCSSFSKASWRTWACRGSKWQAWSCPTCDNNSCTCPLHRTLDPSVDSCLLFFSFAKRTRLTCSCRRHRASFFSYEVSSGRLFRVGPVGMGRAWAACWNAQGFRALKRIRTGSPQRESQCPTASLFHHHYRHRPIVHYQSSTHSGHKAQSPASLAQAEHCSSWLDHPELSHSCLSPFHQLPLAPFISHRCPSKCAPDGNLVDQRGKRLVKSCTETSCERQKHSY